MQRVLTFLFLFTICSLPSLIRLREHHSTSYLLSDLIDTAIISLLLFVFVCLERRRRKPLRR